MAEYISGELGLGFFVSVLCQLAVEVDTKEEEDAQHRRREYLRYFFDGSYQHVACVVDENVDDAAALLHCLIDDFRHFGLRGGDVEGDGLRTAAGEVAELGGVARGGYYFVAVGKGCEGDGSSESGGCARDENGWHFLFILGELLLVVGW